MEQKTWKLCWFNSLTGEIKFIVKKPKKKKVKKIKEKKKWDFGTRQESLELD